jgi:hypothetical protein
MKINLPTQLTLARIAAIPVICLFIAINTEWSSWLSLLLFFAAAMTDWLDGYLARRRMQISKLGQFLDPIADKLLVVAVILFLVQSNHIFGIHIIPAFLILMREIAVSGLREFLAERRVELPVSKLAKWKTAVQMAALSILLISNSPLSAIVGLFLLWVSAVLTVITAWDYGCATRRHFL